MLKLNYASLILISAISLILFGSFLYYTLDQYTYFPDIKSSDRILIFSPHPDDESLGAGGLIKKATEHNATVLVVEMTNGDNMDPAQFNDYLSKINETNYNGTIGEWRQSEALNATKKLGLNQSSVIFLGYPDGGLKPLFEFHWDDNNLFHMTHGSNQFDHSPYSLSYEKNAPYSGSNVEKNVEQIMEDYKPTIVFYPDDGDYHPDHEATSAFVRYAMLDTNYTGQSYTYLVHYHNWPRSITIVPYTNLLIPSQLTTSDSDWLVNKLNINEENAKSSAIYSYSSQLDDLKLLLISFIRKNEVYAIYPKIVMEKVDGIDSIKNQMPSSTYSQTDYNSQNGSMNPPIESGIAYNDENVYLLLNNNQQKYDYYYHLILFNGKTVQQINLKINGKTAEYELKSNNSIKSNIVPKVETNNNIMIITLPRSLFNQTKYIMMSIDFYDTQTNQEVDQTSWRIFQFNSSYITTYNTEGG